MGDISTADVYKPCKTLLLVVYSPFKASVSFCAHWKRQKTWGSSTF